MSWPAETVAPTAYPGAVQPPAPYACKPWESRGRLVAEPESRTRSAFQRDRDRIIHCAAFRRLKAKTQVFVYHEGDNYRTRLTHSLEVAQIARSLARVFGVNEDLTEALALAHDLGHTPFGHAGEDALDAAMAPYGGFDHNAQTLRVVTILERRYPDFDGLNLTWETLEGLIKHNGPLTGRHGTRKGGQSALPVTIRDYDERYPLWLDSYPSVEAQIASIADDIAYNNHDIEDGLNAELFDLDDLTKVPLVGPVFRGVADERPGLDRARTVHEAVREMIGRMVDDVIEETRQRLEALAPGNPDDVRRHVAPVVAFSESMRANDRSLKAFLFHRMYRHHKVNRMILKAKRIVTELFGLFLAHPETLPEEWRDQAGAAGSPETARLVSDYVAGMTDRYAIEEHRRLFDPQT